MIRNNFRFAFRLFSKNLGFSIINIVGLSIGMAATLIILLYVLNELSYDRYHEKANRIYRISMQPGSDPSKQVCFTPPPLAPALVSSFPEIQSISRLVLWKRNVLMASGDKIFIEKNIAMADSSLFDVFTIPFLQGDPADALRRPNTIILTEKMAGKYFGHEDPVGKILTMNNDQQYEITGVIRSIPQNSHFTFDFLIPGKYDGLEWGDGCLQTYLTLPEDYPKQHLESKLPEFVISHMGPWVERVTGVPVEEYFKDENNQTSFHLMPLRDAYMNHNLEGVPGLDALMMKFGNKQNLILFSLLAIFILLIACINFINLSMARSVKRIKEISLRKTMGAERISVIRLFLVESVFLSFIALTLGLIILKISLPFFNSYLNTQLELSGISFLFLICVIITFFVGILSGIYPAFFLSRIKPTEILGKKSGTSFLRSPLSKILLSLQFIISIGLIISTVTIFLQMRHVDEAELGFTKDHVVLIERANALGEAQDDFAEILKRHPDVLSASYATSIPGRHFEPTTYGLEGRPGTEEYLFHTMHADDEFIDVLDLKIIQGRNLTKHLVSDELEAIINEKAVATYQWTDPIGKRIIFETKENGENTYAKVVGVVRDFHFQPLYQQIQPMMICSLPRKGNLLLVKLQPGEMQVPIAFIRDEWNKLTNNQPFQYTFVEDDFQKAYSTDYRTGFLFLLFACLAIFLACLGMLGLVTSTTEQRIREIGIRKVNGANSLAIFSLFSKDYIQWIGIAFIIACPLAYYAMYRFLEHFSSRIPLSWWIFAIAGVFAFMISMITISWQNWRIASRNPIDMLRYE